MIQNGKNLKLNNINSNLPNMSNTIIGWFLDITLEKAERQLVGADWQLVTVGKINTKGVVQPPSDIDLKVLPEGTWNWEWMMLHCLPNADLEVNNFIKYDDKTYKIMAKKDFTKYGYIRYTILEAYKAEQL